MAFLRQILSRWFGPVRPAGHLLGKWGEREARKYLQRQGLKFLASNFRGPRGEIDLVFRDGDCLVFVEVKTRSREDWVRPAKAVDRKKKRALARSAFDYLRSIGSPTVKIRFDIVEVLPRGESAGEIRHLVSAFSLPAPWRCP